MKYLFIIFTLFTTIAHSQNEYVNKTRYIWAESGLSLRNQPSAKANKITVIPYGETVEFIKDTYDIFTIQETKEFKFEDTWIEIRYKNQTGYAFSGYISNVKPPKKDEEITKYLSRVFKPLDKKIIRKYKDCDEGENKDSCISQYVMSYSEGVSYAYWQGEGGGTETLSIPNINFLQAFILAKKYCPIYNQFPLKYHEGRLRMIVVERDDVGCDFTIVENGDFIIINWSGGC